MIILVFFLLLQLLSCEKLKGSIILSENGELKYVDEISKEYGLVYGSYQKDIEKDGWHKLFLTTSKKSSMNVNGTKISGKELWFLESEAAGILEARFSYQQIRDHYMNMNNYYFHETGSKMPNSLIKWFKDQRSWLVEKMEKNKDDLFYIHIKTQYLQLVGMVNEFNRIAKSRNEETISYEQFHVMSSGGDLWDLRNAVDSTVRPKFDKMTVDEIESYFHDTTHCSALFKLAEDKSDIYYFHNTWFPYSWTLRIYKIYDFEFPNADGSLSVNSNIISFPSYPGTLSSIDDLYNTHGEKTDLTVIETTNAVFNTSLFDLVTPKSLLTWQRVQIANRLANSGEEWFDFFVLDNSGTYNNQWMVLNNRKFFPKVMMSKGTFIIGEQIPGRVRISDLTKRLGEGYHPSYNVPYHKDIFIELGYQEQLDKHPELEKSIDYNLCSRSRIFARDQSKVDGMKSLMKLSRYNDYANDPISFKDPSLSLAARHDLKKESPSCRGAFDSKVGSCEMWKSTQKLKIVSGPTTDEDYIPPFNWATVSDEVCDPKSNSHHGLPDLFQNDWIEISPIEF